MIEGISYEENQGFVFKFRSFPFFFVGSGAAEFLQSEFGFGV